MRTTPLPWGASSKASFHEEILPHIQSTPPLVQLEAVSSYPITCHMRKDTNSCCNLPSGGCREHVKMLKKPGGIAHIFWGIDKRQAVICLYYPGVKALLHIRMGSAIFLQVLLAGWILTFSFLICQYMPLTSTIQLILSYTVCISTAQGLGQERRQGE